MNGSEDYREFLCNSLLIKALLQFVSSPDRKQTQEWLKKLQEIEDGMPEWKTRNEYSFYLLLNVQNGNLSRPFNRPPPTGKLKPLCRILPDYLYEEVQAQIKTSTCRVNKMLNNSNDNYEMPMLKCDPQYFHAEQPRPRKGLTALCAAFSNFEDDGKASK